MILKLIRLMNISLDYIEKELQIRNWATVRNNDNSLSFIRSEERAFNGQRCSTEILVTFLNDKEKCYELKVMSHGLSLSVEELSLDKELKSGDAMEQIKVVARFLDSSRMCRGIPLEKEHVSKHQLGTNIVVAVSYIDTIFLNDLVSWYEITFFICEVFQYPAQEKNCFRKRRTFFCSTDKKT